MNNKIVYFLALLGISALVWTCQQSIHVPPINDPGDLEGFLSDSLGIDSCVVRDTLPVSSLPANAQAYLTQNFSQDTLVNVILYRTAIDSLYQADLSSGTIVLFDGAGNFIQSGNPALIPPADLPGAIEDTLEKYFPDLMIDEIEREWNFNGMTAFEISLQNGIEVYVFENGNNICYAFDDDDHHQGGNQGGNNHHNRDCDDGDISIDSLSSTITQHLNSQYPAYTAEGCADTGMLCDSTAVYEIEIEGPSDDELSLVYDQNGAFLYEESKAGLNTAPTAVLDSISTHYPDFEPDERMKVQTLANGTMQYLVEMENDDTDEEITVLFAGDGTVLCEAFDHDGDDGDDDHHHHGDDDDDDDHGHGRGHGHGGGDD